MADVNGIDVYAGNGNIPWQAAKDLGITLAICKATEGTTYQDGQLQVNADACRDLSLRLGTYHFIRPRANSAQGEANYYLDYIRNTIGINATDLCCLDYESFQGYWPLAKGEESITYAYVWLATVGNNIGRPPVLYANLDMLNNYLRWDQRLEQFPLWFAGDRPDLVQWPIFLQQNGYVNINGQDFDADYFGPAYTSVPVIEVEEDMQVWKAVGNSTKVPAVTDGSLWVIVGQYNQGTYLDRAEAYVRDNPTVKPYPVNADWLAEISLWNGGISGAVSANIPTNITLSGKLS